MGAQAGRHDGSGAAAVEFAIILPILVLLLGGIVDFGFAFNAQIGLSHAAREGVRFEAIDPVGEDGAARAMAAYTPLMVTAPSATVDRSCPSSQETAAVTARATYDFIFFPWTRTLTSQAVMRCGG